MRSKAVTVVFAVVLAVVLAVALPMSTALWAATPAKKSKPAGAKKTATKASTAKPSKAKGTAAKGTTVAKGTTASGHTAGRKAVAGTKKSAKSTPAKQTAARFRRSTQREPAPERYKEIQQSLADKGYFRGPVNGAWGADSVDALKRFQRDQNIGDDGKLGSLSLMALGLGPKRGSSEVGAGEKPASPDGGPSPP